MITHPPGVGHVKAHAGTGSTGGPWVADVSAPARTVRDMDTGVVITLGSVNVEADAPRALATFWAQLLGTVVAGDHDSHVFVPAR